MICEKCNKNEATVFLQQNINGESKEHYLCPSCASLNYYNMSFQNILQGFLNNLISSNGIENQFTNNKKKIKVCDCGFSYDDIRKLGKLGCANCYNVFKEEMNEVIKSLQGTAIHNGKIPKKQGEEFVIKRKIKTLKNELKDKIQKEEYEEAARIRDEIRMLEGNGING